MNSFLRIIASAGLVLGIGTIGAATVGADAQNINTNSQTGTNVVSSIQYSTALSGNARATNTSVANSGYATSEAYATQLQTIRQRATNQSAVGEDVCDDCFGQGDDNLVNDNLNTQDALNGADNTQDGYAATGDAEAENESESTTGDSNSLLDTFQEQVQQQRASSQRLRP